MKRSNIGVVLVILLIMSIMVSMSASLSASTGLPLPTKEFYVNDFANIIQIKIENEILHYSAALAEKLAHRLLSSRLKAWKVKI